MSSYAFRLYIGIYRFPLLPLFHPSVHSLNCIPNFLFFLWASVHSFISFLCPFQPLFLNEVLVKTPADPSSDEPLFHVSHIDRVYALKTETLNERSTRTLEHLHNLSKDIQTIPSEVFTYLLFCCCCCFFAGQHGSRKSKQHLNIS